MEELMQVAGFFLGDGFWLDGRLAFSNTNEDLIKYYANLLKRIGFKSRLYRREKPENRKDEFTLVAEKKLTDKIRGMLKALEFSTTPKCKAFLRGMFDAEGTINFSSTRRGREVKISNTDKSIISMIELCLKRLKIVSRTLQKSDKRENRKKCFNVSMYGKSSIDFIKVVRPYKIWSKNYIDGKVNPSYLHLFQ